MKYKVTILTEAGNKIGFGHYIRCKSIYEELLINNISTTLIVNIYNYNFNEENIIVLDWIKNLNYFENNNSQIVIVDSYLANEDIYNKLKLIFYKVIVLDDYNRITYNADILINPNTYFKNINYSNQNSICVGGLEFVILRQEFLNYSRNKIVNSNIESILITLGGSDYRNLNYKLVSYFLKLDIINIFVIAPEDFKIIFTDINVTILKLQTATEMLNLITNSDLVISGCGQTLHELAYLSKPTIGISIDEDQHYNQEFYLEKKFLLKKIHWNDDDLNLNIYKNYLMLNDRNIRTQIKKITDTFNFTSGVANIIKIIKLYI